MVEYTVAQETIETFDVFVEIPKGSRNKYELDKKTGRIRFDRLLYSSMHYPADYGFFPDTLGLDGDPLDALVFVTYPTFPGCVIEIRPIGVFKMSDEKGVDEKILCIPVANPRMKHIDGIKDMEPHYLTEIEHFFATYKDLEKKTVTVKGWASKDEALRIIKECQQRYQQQ